MTRLTLISRTCCHLCDEMEEALLPLLEELGVELHVVDVDSDPLLESAYGELVPVLLHGENELCHYVLDSTKVRDYLREIR